MSEVRFARQLPALDPDTAFFWTSGADGRLRIGRCAACGRYQHPPLPRCPECGGDVSPTPVSGRARVASYTVNQQAWVPGLAVPFVFAAVELVEQAELYVFTNIVGCPVEDVRTGLPVEVTFEQQGEVFLPLFHPVGGADAS
ncbi:OB-fold domain-containing protein [Phenylobacterium sp. LjRoot225]|uniref:Zn-ribbon domain-containing OB-fold protein n=1 Tax=Phenylobacterium sp. LjRoot225 TaxID=3342285 RepID=UPI003ECCA87C